MVSEVNLKEWSTPNTYDSQYKRLPKTKGVYFLVLREIFNQPTGMDFKQTILYVGSSKNLSQRCTNHPVIKKILSDYAGDNCLDVVCYFKTCNNILNKERRLIKLTQPRYNKQWR